MEWYSYQSQDTRVLKYVQFYANPTHKKIDIFISNHVRVMTLDNPLIQLLILNFLENTIQSFSNGSTIVWNSQYAGRPKSGIAGLQIPQLFGVEENQNDQVIQ